MSVWHFDKISPASSFTGPYCCSGPIGWSLYMGPGFLWSLWPWPGNGYAQPCTSGEFVGTLHVTGLGRFWWYDSVWCVPALEADIGPLKRCSLPSTIFQWVGELYGVVHICLRSLLSWCTSMIFDSCFGHQQSLLWRWHWAWCIP